MNLDPVQPLDELETERSFADAPELQAELSFEDREILKRRLEELFLEDEALSTYYKVLIPLLLRHMTGRPPRTGTPSAKSSGRFAIDLDPLITRYINFPRRVSEAMNALVLQLADELSAQTSTSGQSLLRRRRRVQSGHVQMMHALLRLLDKTLATALPQKRFRGTNIEYLLEGDVILRPRIGNLRGAHIAVRRDAFLDPFGSPSHLIEAREVGIDREASARAQGIPLREWRAGELGPLFVDGLEAEALKGAPSIVDATSDALDRLFRRYEIDGDEPATVVGDPPPLLRPHSPEESAREDLVFGDVKYLLESVWLVANAKRRTRATESRAAEIDPSFHDHLAVAFQLMCQEANLRSRLVEVVLVRDRGIRTPTLLVEVDCEQPGALPFEPGSMILVDPLILDDDGEPKRYIHRRAAFVACDADIRAHLGDRAWCQGLHGVYALPVVGTDAEESPRVELNAVGRCFPFGFASDSSNRPSGEVSTAEAILFRDERTTLTRDTASSTRPPLPPSPAETTEPVSPEGAGGRMDRQTRTLAPPALDFGTERPPSAPDSDPAPPGEPTLAPPDGETTVRSRPRRSR